MIVPQQQQISHSPPAPKAQAAPPPARLSHLLRAARVPLTALRRLHAEARRDLYVQAGVLRLFTFLQDEPGADRAEWACLTLHFRVVPDLAAQVAAREVEAWLDGADDSVFTRTVIVADLTDRGRAALRAQTPAQEGVS